MSNPILEAAKQRAKEKAEAALAEAAETARINSIMQGSMSTGIASSTDLSSLVNVTEAASTEVQEEYPVGPQGSYKALNLKRFHTANGSCVQPVDGYFIPGNEEEHKILVHFSTQWGMVEMVPYETAV